MMELDARAQRIQLVRDTASRMMHLHYCDNDVEGVIAYFAPEFSWVGAGEDQRAASREEAAAFFRRFRGAIPRCSIRDEQYDVVEAAPDTYVCSGVMWVATDPGSRMYVKAHQRVTYVFHWREGRLECSHIHCSNPYEEMVEGELFPDRIGRQSFEYVQERLRVLEKEALQRNRQMEVVMASITGGLKISRDDETFSFAYVSPEAAALFGYTLEEFMEATGGTAVGTVYPPDLPRALQDCADAFQDGGLEYATKYRVRCKDGSLKWILDSGKKSRNDLGETLINSLYLDITRSEEDAQEIRRQKELLNSIYDTVPCGILRFLRSAEGFEVISLNRAAMELLGYASEQACKDDWRSGTAGSVLEEDRHILLDSYAYLREVGDFREVEYRVRWPDGSVHWLSGSNMVVERSGAGDVLQRMMFDITESKLLQEQLAQEQEMYRLAMESSSDVMYEYRIREDRFLTYEPRSDREGRESVHRSEIPHYQTALRGGTIVHPDDVSAVIDNICNGRAAVFEARINPPGADGFQWYRVTGKRIARDGVPTRVVGTIRNIHQVKKALSDNMEALHMNQSALQAISGVYVSIYYADLAEDWYYGVRIPEYRPGFSFGRTGRVREGLARYIRTCVDPEDRERMLRFCDLDGLRLRLRALHDRVSTEYCHRTRDYPEGLWLRLEVQLISLEDGAPKNAVLTFRNVSEERRRELEHQKEEAKAKRALEEAYEAANRANRAKSEFLSKMSHDIRTPMNAVLGMATIGERCLDDPAQVADCLAKIKLAGDHLLELINEVLDMSKLESGSFSLKEERFRLEETVRRGVEMLRPDLGAKGQELVLELEALRHEAVCGDPVRVQEILLNLLSNAVKYTPEGGRITVRLREKRSPAGGVGCYELTVEDNGIGMDEAFLEKVFRPFERAEDSRVSRTQGTGLGMAIAQNLVHMMNGSIQVDSRLNEGTRFTATVFLKLADRADAPEPRPEDGGEDITFDHPWRILLAEDNDLNREIARTLLEMAGLRVDEAVNGQEAVERFRASEPGGYPLVLMDIQMPVMDGYQAARAIRALERPDAGSVPIIALTANAFADDVCRAGEAGMDGHLSKPLDVGALLRTLKRWLPE